MATLQEQAAAVYTPEYFNQLRAKNAWAGKPWITAGGINEAGGAYRHALYEDGTFSPLMQAMRSDAEQQELVRNNMGDAASWMYGSPVPLRDLTGGQWVGNNYRVGDRDYTLDMERKASDGETGDLVRMIITALTMGYGATAGAGAGAAEGAATTGAFDAGMGNYLGLGTTADATAVGSSLGLGDVAAVGAGTAAAGGGAATAGQSFDPSLIGSEMGSTTATADPGFLSRLSSFVQGSGDLTAADLLKLQTLGKAGSGILGLIGAEQKEDAQQDRAAEMDARTRPYRLQLAELYANPEAYLSSPAVTGPVDQGTQSLLRGLSARHGNPFGSGTALQEAHNYAATALSRELGNEKARLAVLSGVPNAAAAYPGASQAAIDAGSGIYDVLGSTLYDITNPRPTLAQLLEEIRKMGGTTGGKVATGGYTGAAV